MPTNYKVLVQSNPTAATYTDLYTVPAGKSAVISTITVANTSSASAVSYRLAVTASATAASAVALADHFAYDVSVEKNDTIALTLGLAMEAGKKLVGRTSASPIVFGIFGSEIT